MAPTQTPPRRILIVGGGSAGWMTASLMIHAWGHLGVDVTLLESERIPPIGVGEGSTPSLKLFFAKLGIPESDWMPKCNATYKCGIRFPHWVEDGQTHYVHPFYSEGDAKTGHAFIHNANLRRQGYEVDAHPDWYWLQTKLIEQNLSPIHQEGAYDLDYGYHFDSTLLGEFLKGWATARGVTHRVGTLESVIQDDTGAIVQVRTQADSLEADFFVDCTGFAGVLIDKTLNVPFNSFDKELFNDRAIAIPSPIDPAKPISPVTTSTALSCGWAWQIPLANRWGNGYVYSSEYISDEDAEQELRQLISCQAGSAGEARVISMKLGRRERHWEKNVLAVGLSQGFIEPLEATALSTMQYTVELFIQTMNRRADGDNAVGPFNRSINAVYDAVKDYIVAHYRLNRRQDSAYWRDNASNTKHSERLQELLRAWDKGEVDFEARLQELDAEKMYFSPSWYCLFAGKGRFSRSLSSPPSTLKVAPTSQVNAYCLHYSQGFIPHNEQLERVYGKEKSQA